MKSSKSTMPNTPKTKRNNAQEMTVPTDYSLQDIAGVTNGEATGKKKKNPRCRAL
jgi:hypothetical protein